MIFISHNSKDKPIIEPFALKLREVYGESKVFYDSWSIQPGDGIINRMNECLSDTAFFLLFVSENSLRSKMVGLEWQNALMASMKGQLRLIPIRLDSSIMPPVLMQILYIDAYTHGFEIAIRQIIDVIEGNSTFRPLEERFSNLVARIYQSSDSEIVVAVHAKMYMEPHSTYAVVTEKQDDCLCGQYGSGLIEFSHGPGIYNGQAAYYHCITVQKATTPKFPVRFSVHFNKKPLDILAIVHEKAEGIFEDIPIELAEYSLGGNS